MAGKSIERRGVDDVMKGFELYETINFSVWCDKQLKFSYIGDDEEAARKMLMESLEALEANNATAIYTIRMHKECGKDGYIENNTPYIGSFNFKVDALPQPGIDAARFVSVPNAQVMERLERIEKALIAEDAEAVEQDEFSRKAEVIGSIINNPLIQQLAGIFMGKIFGINTPAPAIAINGVPGEHTQEEKINAALQVLMQKDDKLGDHLLILADMAMKNPAKFNMLIGML